MICLQGSLTCVPLSTGESLLHQVRRQLGRWFAVEKNLNIGCKVKKRGKEIPLLCALFFWHFLSFKKTLLKALLEDFIEKLFKIRNLNLVALSVGLLEKKAMADEGYGKGSEMVNKNKNENGLWFGVPK